MTTWLTVVMADVCTVPLIGLLIIMDSSFFWARMSCCSCSSICRFASLCFSTFSAMKVLIAFSPSLVATRKGSRRFTGLADLLGKVRLFALFGFHRIDDAGARAGARFHQL